MVVMTPIRSGASRGSVKLRDLVRCSDAGQHLFEMGFDHEAKLGQQQALTLAVKHRRADLCFEFFAGCGQCRLLHIASLCRAVVTGMFVKGEEISDLLEFHDASSRLELDRSHGGTADTRRRTAQ